MLGASGPAASSCSDLLLTRLLTHVRRAEETCRRQILDSLNFATSAAVVFKGLCILTTQDDPLGLFQLASLALKINCAEDMHACGSLLPFIDYQ